MTTSARPDKGMQPTRRRRCARLAGDGHRGFGDGRRGARLIPEPLGGQSRFSIALCLCLASCALPPEPRSAPRTPSSIVVCDSELRRDVREALLAKFPGAQYLWTSDLCNRATLLAEYLPPQCGAIHVNCEIPEFLDGVKLAGDEPPDLRLIVLARMRHEVRTESGYRGEWATSHQPKGGKYTRYVPYREQVETPGLTGAVYVVAPRTAVVLGARELRAATTSDLAVALSQILCEIDGASCGK